jgi:hypothetical protein
MLASRKADHLRGEIDSQDTARGHQACQVSRDPAISAPNIQDLLIAVQQQIGN